MNLSYCCKNNWVVLLIAVGVFLASAFLFISLVQAAEEAQIQDAISDLNSATGQNITSEDQARDLCNQEQYLDLCADIGKKHDLYTEEEVKHVDDFLSEVKGKILEDIKSCTSEECLIKVASELANKVQKSNPTLATSLKLTTTIVAEKKAVVDAATEVGVNFGDCEAMNPDTAPVDLLRKCAKLAKDSRVQKYIPEDRRVLAQQFEDSATVKLRESLVAGKYQCGDGTLEGCGNYCLNPGVGVTEIPAVCKQIATEVFGSKGVKELELAYQHVGQTRDFYSKKFILVLPNGKELVGEGQIRNTCDQAFSDRNFEIAKACGNFAVKNGFASQAEVDKGLKLMESFSQKGKNVDFEKCINDPRACRDFIPDEDRGRFDAGYQIFEIMKTEIGFDPSQCERGSVDETIGMKCFEGSKRALAKIESLGLVSQSKEAGFIIEDIKRHVSEGDNFIQKKDEFRQVFSQQGGPGGCKSTAECFTYCSNPTNGPECISFGAKQEISGFKGEEAVQRFQEYNQNLQRPGLVSDEYRPFPPGGPYPQFPGQGPYPGFQPPGQEYAPPGQVPGFTQPGPGFGPPPGTGPHYPPPFPGGSSFGGPSPECLAALQSGDFTKAKAVCNVPSQEHIFITPPICPAAPYIECPAGQYHESYRNPDGCWIDGPCKPAPTYSPGPYPTYTYSPPPPPPGGYQCSDGLDNDNDGKTDYPADTSCYGPEDSDEYYPPSGISPGTSPYPTFSSVSPCPSGQWWDYTYKTCTSATPPPSCPSGQWWDYVQNKCSSSASPYPTGPYPTYTGGTSTPPYPTYTPTTQCNYNNFCDQGEDGAYCKDCAGTPYPNPSGACPSGYHYHGESGGFCMNDQENYSGTCYDSVGTSKIACPAQPTYSPYPSPSGTPTSGGSCPSGSHTMYVNNAGGYCMSDSDPSKCGPLNSSSVSSFGSCSSYQGSTTSPYPTSTTYTPYPTSTQTYSPSPTTYSPSPTHSEPPPTTYSPSPTTYSPSPTTYSPSPTHSEPPPSTYSPPPTTYSPPPTYSEPPPSTYSPPPSTYSPPPPTTSGLYNHHMVVHCQQLGRKWDGKVCEANGLFARFYENSGLANILRFFYIVP